MDMLGRAGQVKEVIYVVRSPHGTQYVGMADKQYVGHRLAYRAHLHEET